VVFSDLSGFTALSEHLDPEDVQEIMSGIFAQATEIITRYSGRVDKLIGDAIMAVYGDPVTHEDDAERAVRATQEIHAAVDDLSPKYEESICRSLVMHSGINTGVVITSTGQTDTADTGPLGDTINLASRLEGLSQPGEILLGPETAAMVDSVFELADHGHHDLKGKSGQIAVRRVIGLNTSRSGSARRQGTFVGRHEELGILLGAVEKVQDGVGTVIGIKAEAGAGKTRLLAEFRSRVPDAVQWLEGRAYAYGENIPFSALTDLVSNSLGIDEEDTQQSIAVKLREGITGLVTDPERILDPFHRLYGLPLREEAGLDKENFRPRLLESVATVVEGLAAQAPTVLVFQDLHWADPSTVGIIGALIDAVESPIVIVVNYRPSFLTALPTMRELDLQSLSPRQTGELVQSLLDTEEPPAGLVEFITQRTDGNPFYLEEILNSLLETGVVLHSNDRWEMQGSFEEADMPMSVRGVIAARIDRLGADRRRVLREASVVGREFLYDIIRRVATEAEDLDPSLTELESADLIRERPEQRDLEYFFKHALTQDVAYEGLLRQERITLHARAAAAIEEQFDGRLEEVIETLAYHYAEGAVDDKAVHYLRLAGLKAMDRYALVESQAHFEKAYAIALVTDEGPARDAAIAGTVLDWSILFYYRATLPQLDELMNQHEDSIQRLDDERLTMWWNIWRGHCRGFLLDARDVLDYLDPALATATRLGDETAIAYAQTWRGWAFWLANRTADAIETADSITDYTKATRVEDPYPYLKNLAQKCLSLGFTGHYEESERLSNELIEFGVASGNTRCQALGYHMKGSYLIGAMSLDASAEAIDRAIEIAIDPVYSESARMVRAMAAAAAGEPEVLAEHVAENRRQYESGVRLVMPMYRGLLEALDNLSGADPIGAFEYLLRASDEARSYGREIEAVFSEFFTAIALGRVVSREAGGDWRTLVRNPRLLKYGRLARREAVPRFEALLETGAHGLTGFLPLLRYEYAKVLNAQGETARAKQQLDEASDQVGRLGDTEGLRRINGLLTSISS
jgi:class 3 adenylate cyclase